MNKSQSGKQDLTIIVGVAAFVFIIVVFLATLWKLGLFAYSSSESGVKLIAAVLALLGVLGTAMISLIGLLFKRSYDSHNLRLKEETERRLVIEAQRNQSLHKEAENRLRMETAINAVSLMSTSTGEEASESQQAGALFALASLGQIDFSIALLQKMWPTNRIDSISAIWVIDKALKTDSETLQKQAAEILCDNSIRLLIPDGYCWPSSLSLSWNLSISVNARETILQTIITLLLAQPLEKWKECNLNSLFAILHRIFSEETEPRIQSGVALTLDVLLSVMQNLPSGQIGVYSVSGEIIFSELQPKISDFIKKTGAGTGGVGDAGTQISDVIKELRHWASSSQEEKGS